MATLPAASPQHLYLTSEAQQLVQSRAKRLKKYAIIGAGTLLSAALLIGGYTYSNRYALQAAWDSYHEAQDILHLQQKDLINIP